MKYWGEKLEEKITMLPDSPGCYLMKDREGGVIYVGKAVPTGWRQSRNIDATSGSALFGRLRQHAESIKAGKGLKLSDFACRFAILEDETVNMVAALQAAIIAEHSPLWNSVIDGFHIPREHVRIITLDFRPWQIVLASDGYPFLCPTLAESEQRLQHQRATDPLNISPEFQATKAFHPDFNSFDDRTYIRLDV